MYVLVGLGLVFLFLCGLYVLTYFRGKFGWSKLVGLRRNMKNEFGVLY